MILEAELAEARSLVATLSRDLTVKVKQYQAENTELRGKLIDAEKRDNSFTLSVVRDQKAATRHY